MTAPAAVASSPSTVAGVSTPNAVLDRPDAVVVLGRLTAHGAAMLLHGMDLRRVQLERLRELGVMGAEAFSERHDPLRAAAAALDAALAEWTRAHGWDRRDGDAAVDASWPAEPLLPETPLSVVQLWETRLGADYVAMAVMDETAPGFDPQAEHARFAPLRALYDVVLGSLLTAGFTEDDL